jgi:Ca2+-transporting ATPase
MRSGTSEKDWHTRSSSEVVAALDVDPSVGLAAADVSARLDKFGANVLADETEVPVWKKVLRLLADKMILVLIVAAVVSAVVSREWETPVVILAVIVLNTILKLGICLAEVSPEIRNWLVVSVATTRLMAWPLGPRAI